MGLRLLDLPENYAMLIVDFDYWIQPDKFYDSSKVEEAMEYFGLEISLDNRLKRKQDPNQMLIDKLGISIEQSEEFLNQLKTLSAMISEEDAKDVPLIFPKWNHGEHYKVGDRVYFAEEVMECIKEHTAHRDGNPIDLHKFWRYIKVYTRIESWYPDNNYARDDLVSYENKLWKSLVDGNNFIPVDSQGWVEIQLGKKE